MDALTSKALESLVKEYFPKLAIHLDQLYTLTPDKRQVPTDMLSFLNETFELLKIIDKWANNTLGTQNNSLNPELTEEEASIEEQPLSDDEAMMLLAEMDAPATAPVVIAENESSASADIGDDEAYRLLAEMDAPATSDNQTNTVELPPTITAANVEEDEDEALKMLRELGDFESSDETVLEVPATKPAPAMAKSSAAASVTSPVQAEESHDSDEDYQELPEWVDNDFRNDADMMNDFLNNAEELLETLDGTILKLEANPNNREIIEEIFRAAHTLKGAAGMFGFKAIEALMHKLENLFDLIRKDKLQANSQVVDLVFKGLDTLKTLVGAIKANKASGLILKPIIVALIRVAKGKSAGTIERSSSNSEKPAETEAKKASSDSEHSETKSSAAAQDDHGRAGATSNKKADSTIRVDLERLDALVNLVGELVTDRTRFIAIEDELRHKFSQLQLTADMSETVQLFGRHMNEVQDIIMKVRMVPIGNAFNKYPRVVRDLARQLDKKIELIIEGEATELDKTLVEQIGDPLIHLIRNACDHGVETPQVRTDSGKGPVGFVHLRAFQEGNNIVITIEDDGKGMDPAKLRSKAIEKGLIKEDDHLEKSQIFDLIFEPGFSTAEVVTNVSGRGVGMDVVKKQIAKLKGNITIDSQIGSGSTITISLPLTLAIVQSLLVQSNHEYYAIPLASIIESIRINRSDIQKVGDIEVVKRMDKVLPLIHLDKTLNLSQKKNNFWYAKNSSDETQKNIRQKNNDKLFVVVVGAGEKRFGIVVDGLLHQQEMVIKPMGSLLRGVPCVAGGAVLGGGEVVLVLDMQELENFFKHSQRSPGINSLSA
ncbi:MAG: chemotaxis protein CheA [Oligoflexales bacterium]|nr:chemotaxis protein CheA [Oligoflexales bacterium]